MTAWRGTTLGRDITYAISLIMPLRFVRRLRNNMAQSLVLYVKSDARYGRRLAAPIPSFKLHIPFISTPAQALVSGVGVPPNLNHQADNLAKLRHEFLPVIELIEKIFGAVSRTKA